MGRTAEKTLEYQFSLLRGLYDQVTEPQQKQFHRIYGPLEDITEEKVGEAIAICERTIQKNSNK